MYLNLTVSIIFFALVVINSTKASIFIIYHLSAKDLPNSDPGGGPPDPYCVLKSANDDNPWAYDGETKYILDTNNPSWPEEWKDSLWIQIERSTVKLHFEVYDSDTFGSDYLGQVTIPLTDLIYINNQKVSTDFTYLTKPLKDGYAKGTLTIKSRIELITTREVQHERKRSSGRRSSTPQDAVLIHCILVFLLFILQTRR